MSNNWPTHVLVVTDNWLQTVFYTFMFCFTCIWIQLFYLGLFYVVKSNMYCIQIYGCMSRGEMKILSSSDNPTYFKFLCVSLFEEFFSSFCFFFFSVIFSVFCSRLQCDIDYGA